MQRHTNTVTPQSLQFIERKVYHIAVMTVCTFSVFFFISLFWMYCFHRILLCVLLLLVFYCLQCMDIFSFRHSLSLCVLVLEWKQTANVFNVFSCTRAIWLCAHESANERKAKFQWRQVYESHCSSATTFCWLWESQIHRHTMQLRHTNADTHETNSNQKRTEFGPTRSKC